MSAFLSIETERLHEKRALHTAREISQQPRLWRIAADHITQERAALDAWLQPLLARADLRIILTGAGTSAYIGEALAPHIAQHMRYATQQVEAIGTTDLVGNPTLYLHDKRPTLLVSFARSGNSPESLAAVARADQLCTEIHHLVITCNPDGTLAKQMQGKSNCHTLLMPDGSDDQSFAMTSSFSCMLISALCLFAPDARALAACIGHTEAVIRGSTCGIQELHAETCTRMVFLGAGVLKAYAREAALKVLELTAGRVTSFYESPLGFRHGPKSVVDSDTLIVLMASTDAHTHLYDTDLCNELNRDAQSRALVPLQLRAENGDTDIADIWAGLPHVVWCQMLAFHAALELGISPDNPCPEGFVNRVVQGVILHDLTPTP